MFRFSLHPCQSANRRGSNPRAPLAHGMQVVAIALLMALGALMSTSACAATPREVTWEDLVPKGWDGMKQFRDKGQSLRGMRDSDPRAAAMLQELREMWDRAPTRSDLDGVRVKIAGYVVPLDWAPGGMKEFLLVPYFGACIHTPPPPANQIVHVVLTGARPLRTMEPIWVTGVLRTSRKNSLSGASGYVMDTASVEAYERRAP